MTEYEVKSHETLAWYKGYVHDYDDNKKQFLVMYDRNWKPAHYVDPGDIRPVADPTPPNWKPSADEICECRAQADENEPYGWWKCQVKQIKNNRYFITFEGFDQVHEIEKDSLRPLNDKKPLSARNMAKENIDIPPDLLTWILSNPKEIADLRQLTHIKIDEKNKRLVLIGTKKALHVAKGMIKLHFQKQKDLKDLESKAQLDEAKLEEQRQKEGSAVKRSFPIHPLLTGFLLGPKRKNTQAIKQELPDIVYIRPKDGMCEIAAMNPQTLDEACERLEIVARKVAIPQKEMAPIIGSKGGTITKIKDRVGKDDVRIISWFRFPTEFKRLKERYEERLANRKKQQEGQKGKQQQQQQTADADEFIDDDNVSNVKNTKIDDIFSPSDYVDLTNGNTKDGVDYLVVIGRRSRVELCISMIEVTLEHLRKFQEHRDKIKQLKRLIKDIKGYEPDEYYEEEQQDQQQSDQQQEQANVEENRANGEEEANVKDTTQTKQKFQKKKEETKKQKAGSNSNNLQKPRITKM